MNRFNLKEVSCVIFESQYRNSHRVVGFDVDSCKETEKAVCVIKGNYSLWFPKAALSQKSNRLMVKSWFKFDPRAHDVFSKLVCVF